MKQLTSGEVNRGLKKGWGLSDFLDKFGICDEEELFEKLSAVYVKGPVVNSVLRRMRKNDKKASWPSVKQHTEAIAITEPNIIPIVNPLLIEDEAVDIPKVSEEAIISENSEENILEALEENEKEFETEAALIITEAESKKAKKMRCEEQLNEAQEILIELEKERKNLFRENQEISCKIAGFKESIERWLAELAKQQEGLKNEIDHLNENKAKLEANTEKMDEYKKSIQNLEEEINKLTEIVVYIGAKNEVEADYKLSDEISAIGSAEVKEKMAILLENDEGNLLDEFSVGQTKQLAKMLLMVDKVLEIVDNVDKSQIVILADEENILTTWLQLNEWNVKTCN